MSPSSSGSSPLARGLLTIRRKLCQLVRIIPARAGFTHHSPKTVPTRKDHPRSRGVYLTRCDGPYAHLGSSPLARGLRDLRGGGHDGDGIIPARAGFTPKTLAFSSDAGDHPRSRGVYASLPHCQRRPEGSSPLARGLLLDVRLRLRLRGIIPARAGFTATWWTDSVPQEDHPRSRGVYPKQGVSRHADGGSSPLARGLRLLSVSLGCGGRIIPARAGFT